VVSPEHTAASYLENLVVTPKITDLIVVRKGNAELVDIPVENENIIGKKIGDISPTDAYIICALHSKGNGDIYIPSSETILEEGFRVSVMVKSHAVKQVVDLFTK
jgi:trk system potassium uptake protein